MKFETLISIVCLVSLLCILGCEDPAAKSQEACVNNLQILNGAAKSHALEHNISETQLINPEDLTSFLKEGRVPKCPLGAASYQPFTLQSGPTCPNSAAHTAKFREWLHR